ncbi:hypothetical protein MLD38_025008 [Melastoma candidum]|uniref:Uncharacterized protein n=1 Tax=Melastoma candidum TaxID=119954 RepID=A0ACB9NWW9_9MYRT|nr:hypothetical protein MLD38_025008 [Melastoma candidum]
MAATPEKRCLYDVLGLPRDCSPEEIRSAYKKLALQRHPDKLIQTGVSPDDATAQFQELLHAYETLSDPKQRSWYDSHRSQILFSDPNAASGSPIPDLFAFFSTSVFSGYSDSGKGFYKVYSDVFNKIYANEVNFAKKMGLGVDAVKEAPLMGNLDSPYEQVTAFYSYWLGFCTVMDFVWADVYDAERGENRKSRRVMEEENKKVRKKAKREYNETVRGLVEFVKKRDKRVILRKKEEEERRKKKEEERERERKEKLEREKAERARKYEEAEWTRVEDDVEEWEDEEDGEEREEEEEEEGELYCVACGKKFKSKKQWENHEKSKKHKEKVDALRKSFVDDDFHEDEEGEVNEEDDELEDMTRKVQEAFDISEDKEEDRKVKTEERNVEDEGIDFENGMSEEQGRSTEPNNGDHTGEAEEVVGSSGDDGGIDEVNLLAAMLGGRKNRRKMAAMEKESISRAIPQNREEDTEFMEYDNRKGSRRSRGNKKDKARKNNASAGAASETATNNLDEKVTNDSPDQSRGRDESKEVTNGDATATNPKVHDKKRGMKADDGMSSKMKNTTTKGRKAKAASKYLDNICEGCGEEFDSRNKLHKHLGETGHATLKFHR